MSTVVFRNKTGGSETLYAVPGQNLLDVLRLHGIPANAVLSYRNGAVIPESAVVVEADEVIEVRQVRHYDLDVLRKPKEHVYAAPDPVYSKSVLFDHGGTLERRTEQLTAETFVQYVEETFVQSITSGGTMRAGDRAVIGLSGGRDSVAYLKLLERTRGRWPEIDMTAVTITGLPDWDEPHDLPDRAGRLRGSRPGPHDRDRRRRGRTVQAARAVRRRDEQGRRRMNTAT